MSKNIGGAQLLFARMAEFLVNNGEKVHIIDVNDSFIVNYLTTKQLEFRFTLASQIDKTKLSDNDLLVLSLSYLSHFRNFIEPDENCKIVFWDLHPYALIESTAFSIVYKKMGNSSISQLAAYFERGFIKKMKKFISYGTSNNSVYFMCKHNFDLNNNLFNLNIEPIFLPIPIPIPISNNFVNAKPLNEQIDEELITINLCWLSRIDEDKLPILLLLLEDIIDFNLKSEKFKIQLHIIGNGNAFVALGVKIKELNIAVKLPGVLFGEELDLYLNKFVELGISMGTSALEFGIRKIPTVLVSSTTAYNFFKNRNKRYIWLPESSGYDLAIDQSYIRSECCKLSGIIDNYLQNNIQLANSCHQYVKRNHSLNEVFSRFLYLTSQSSLTYSKLNNSEIFKLSLLQSIFFKLKEFLKTIIDGKRF